MSEPTTPKLPPDLTSREIAKIEYDCRKMGLGLPANAIAQFRREIFALRQALSLKEAAHDKDGELVQVQKFTEEANDPLSQSTEDET